MNDQGEHLHDRRVFDQAELMRRLVDDRTLALIVIKEFLTDIPKRIEELEASLSCDDTASAWRRAHAIKGAAITVGADLVRAAAEELEGSARSGDLGGSRRSSGDLRTALDEFRAAVADLYPELSLRE